MLPPTYFFIVCVSSVGLGRKIMGKWEQICRQSAYSYSALSQVTHLWGAEVYTARVNEGSHSFARDPHVCPQVEWTIPAFPPQPQIVIALWPVLICRPPRLEGWVGLSGWSQTEVVYSPADGHPSQYQPGPAYSNFVDRDQRATSKPSRHPVWMGIGINL